MMNYLNTRIVLRNDSTTAWIENDSAVLLKGEVGIEFLASGKAKMKIGDGTSTWAQLPYFGGEDSHVFEVTRNDGETDTAAINRVVGETTLVTGDVAIVKALIVSDKYSYTGYVYNGTAWAAMDGNYNADNIYFPEDLVLTRSFGKYIPGASGNVTFPLATNKLSLAGAFADALSEVLDPEVTEPSAKITITHNSSVEVGTSVTPGYKITFDSGKYEYGYEGDTSGATGVTATAYSVTDSVGNTNTLQNGTMPSVVVLDDTDYKINATVSYSAGKVPVNNVGREVADMQIDAGSVETSDSTALKGYRSFFYGAVKVAPSTTEMTSEIIRSLKNGGNYNATKSLTISANGATDLKAFVVAIPNDNTRSGITKVESTTGMTVDVTGSYVLSTETVSVADARGTVGGVVTNPVDYKFYVWEPASIDSATVHKINLG